MQLGKTIVESFISFNDKFEFCGVNNGLLIFFVVQAAALVSATSTALQVQFSICEIFLNFINCFFLFTNTKNYN